MYSLGTSEGKATKLPVLKLWVHCLTCVIKDVPFDLHVDYAFPT